MTLTFQRESLLGAKAEIEPLLERHWQEVALDKDTIPLEPDWEWYRALEEAGILFFLTARGDGHLVGYVIYLISPKHLHYMSLRYAEGDAFWLAPEQRKGTAGIRLMREAEVLLKAEGVRKIFNKSKIHFDLTRLFEHMGYRTIETVYAKTIA